MAFERSTTANSKTIDIHFTSSRKKHVDVVKGCCRGLSKFVDANVFLYFCKREPNLLKFHSVSDGWTQTREVTLQSPLDDRELRKAKKCPEKFCTRILTLEKSREDAVNDPVVTLHVTGGKTNVWLTLAKSTEACRPSSSESKEEAAGWLEREVTKEEIAELSPLICSLWDSVADLLSPELSAREKARISKFYEGDLAMQAERMLEVWVDFHGKRATALSLCRTLLTLNLRLAVEKVFGTRVVDILKIKTPKKAAEVLDKQLCDEHLRKVYLRIGEFRFRVARALGGVALTEDEIDTAERSKHHAEDRCYAMLHGWMIKQKGKGTIHQLCSAMLKVELDDTIKEVFGENVLLECRKREHVSM
eukprot:m.55819 g.55819  ORF g.55819 m.55819 type:complete len:362 (+) comp34504_c0_seq1:120-1205(+)